jgi:ABC-type transport system involved in cytochrome bd biosynthesis fused ATPase/permease subunit
MVLCLAATMVTPLMMVASARCRVAACGNSVERVRQFLSQKNEDGAGREPAKTLDAARKRNQQLPLAIQAEKCVFEWRHDNATSATKFQLGEESDSLSLNVRKGEMVAVVGAAGQGTSSLLHAISGIMPRKQGVLVVDGEIAHCGQVTKLLARGSLLENIVFGLPYDVAMLNRALQCTHCQEHVVDQLPKGVVCVALSLSGWMGWGVMVTPRTRIGRSANHPRRERAQHHDPQSSCVGAGVPVAAAAGARGHGACGIQGRGDLPL